jgi:hypothetical protein
MKSFGCLKKEWLAMEGKYLIDKELLSLSLTIDLATFKASVGLRFVLIFCQR